MADTESQTGPRDEDVQPVASVDPSVESRDAVATEGQGLAEDDRDALLADLARAMHDAADAHHAHALEVVERRSAAYVQGIREQAVADAETIRDQANQDIAAIQDWAETEIKRIRAERERRAQARRSELEALLEQRDAQVEWEIGAIEATVVSHRADLDTFFSRLRSETDVSEIARLAQDAPRLPELDAITAGARLRASAAQGSWDVPVADVRGPDGEPDVVGIMADQGAIGSSPLDATPTDVLEASGEPRAPSARPVSQPAVSGSVLQAIPTLRPVAAWLGQDDEDAEKDRSGQT